MGKKKQALWLWLRRRVWPVTRPQHSLPSLSPQTSTNICKTFSKEKWLEVHTERRSTSSRANTRAGSYQLKMELLAIRPGACLRDLRDVGSHSRNFLQPKLFDVLSTVNVFAVVWMNQRYRECKHMQTGCQIAKHNHLSPSLSRHFHQTKRFRDS